MPAETVNCIFAQPREKWKDLSRRVWNYTTEVSGSQITAQAGKQTALFCIDLKKIIPILQHDLNLRLCFWTWDHKEHPSEKASAGSVDTHCNLCCSPLVGFLDCQMGEGSFPGQQSSPIATGPDHLYLTTARIFATQCQLIEHWKCNILLNPVVPSETDRDVRKRSSRDPQGCLATPPNKQATSEAVPAAIWILSCTTRVTNQSLLWVSVVE